MGDIVGAPEPPPLGRDREAVDAQLGLDPRGQRGEFAIGTAVEGGVGDQAADVGLDAGDRGQLVLGGAEPIEQLVGVGQAYGHGHGHRRQGHDDQGAGPAEGVAEGSV